MQVDSGFDLFRVVIDVDINSERQCQNQNEDGFPGRLQGQINNVVLDEVSLPSQCDPCRNCLHRLTIEQPEPELWTSPQYVYGGQNNVSLSVIGHGQVCGANLQVRLHFQQRFHVEIYDKWPNYGPLTGQTNVSVNAAVDSSGKYECVFGKRTSSAYLLKQVGPSVPPFTTGVWCLSPAESIAQQVRFSVREVRSTAVLLKTRSIAEQYHIYSSSSSRDIEKKSLLTTTGIDADHNKGHHKHPLHPFHPHRRPSDNNYLYFGYYRVPSIESITPVQGSDTGGDVVHMLASALAPFVSTPALSCQFGQAESPQTPTFLNATHVTCVTPSMDSALGEPDATVANATVPLLFSENGQSYQFVTNFTYQRPKPPSTTAPNPGVNLTFPEVGLIAGGVLMLLCAVLVFLCYVCARRLKNRQYAQLRTVDADGETTMERIDVATIKLQNRIGKGSFAEVYRGYWRGVEIAVKKLPAHGMSDDARQDFDQEAQLMARLRHPNVLQYLGTCHVPPDIWILTEFMQQGSLYQILHTRDLELSWDLIVSVLLDVAKGMHYLHSMTPPIIHRDMKSHNVLINEHWTAKVCDFGLSVFVHESRTMTACGTPCWTAPEVLRNQRYTTRADVYSFGIVMWECVTRDDPFGSMPPFQVIFAVGTQGARPPFPLQTPIEIKLLIEACWDEDPDERPGFGDLIERLLSLKLILGSGESNPSVQSK